MKKRVIFGSIAAGLLLLGAIGSAGSPQSNSSNSSNLVRPLKSNTVTTEPPQYKPICDGTIITKNCTAEGIHYSTYIYHPAVAEKSHTETVTTYEQQVTGYCTLCNDGTYSPSCATGRGACSHHGGVAQWNAPRYSNVPVYSTKTVIDAPAQAAYFEKVAQ